MTVGGSAAAGALEVVATGSAGGGCWFGGCTGVLGAGIDASTVAAAGEELDGASLLLVSEGMLHIRARSLSMHLHTAPGGIEDTKRMFKESSSYSSVGS